MSLPSQEELLGSQPLFSLNEISQKFASEVDSVKKSELFRNYALTFEMFIQKEQGTNLITSYSPSHAYQILLYMTQAEYDNPFVVKVIDIISRVQSVCPLPTASLKLLPNQFFPVCRNSYEQPQNVQLFSQFFSLPDFFFKFLEKGYLISAFNKFYFTLQNAELATQFTQLFFSSKCLEILSTLNISQFLSMILHTTESKTPILPQCPIFLAKLFSTLTKYCNRVSSTFSELNGFNLIMNTLSKSTPRHVCDTFIELLESQAETRSSSTNAPVLLFMYQLFQEKPRLRQCIFDALYQSMKRHPDRIEGMNSIVRIISWFSSGTPNLPHYFDMVSLLDSYCPSLIKRCFPYVLSELINEPKEPSVYANLITVIDHQMAMGSMNANNLILLDFYSAFIFQPPPSTLVQIFTKSLSFGPLILEVYKLQTSASFRYTVFESVATALTVQPDSGVIKAFLMRLIGIAPTVSIIQVFIDKGLIEHIPSALSKSKEFAAIFVANFMDWIKESCPSDLSETILNVLESNGYECEIQEFRQKQV